MNIFFILTDGICNYERKDEKSILPIYKKLVRNKEGFYFSNVVSLFPSTIFSINSIFTGKFPYYVMPNFYSSPGGYKLKTYFDDLKKDYNINSIICWNLGRYWLKDILNPVGDDSLYKGDKQLEAFEIYKLFKNLLNKSDLNKNNFFYVHFRAGDKNMNQYCEKIITELKRRNLWKNSIFIMTSDHGYYDKERYKRFQPLHFDDIKQSSLSPATFIKLPNNLTNAKPRIINKRIYLIDILETVLDYLNIKPSIKNRQAISFKKIIEDDEDINKDRIVRGDAYLKFQPVKKTVVIKNNWKLVYENENFKLFNLNKDEKEVIDIKKKKKNIFSELYNFYLKTERESFKIITPILDEFFKLSELSKIKNQNIFIPKKQFPHELVNYLKDKLSKKNKIIENYNNYSKKDIILILFFNRLTGFGIKELKKKYSEKSKEIKIIDLKFEELKKEQLKEIGYKNFVLSSLKKRRKVILQRPQDILIWVFYMPIYFNKHLKKYY